MYREMYVSNDKDNTKQANSLIFIVVLQLESSCKKKKKKKDVEIFV